jgi:hypothetical protein
MTTDRSKCITLKRNEGNFTFVDNGNSKIVGKGTLNIDNGKDKVEKVICVENLKHNLLSVSHMCDQGNNLTFNSWECEIIKPNSSKLVVKAIRTPNNVYVFDKINGEKCFIGKIDESWLWHKTMGHMKFDNLVKIDIKQVVRDMSEITKSSRSFNKQCQHGKQSRVRFKTKEYATSKSFELVHIDIFGPTITKSLQGELYFMLLTDDYIRMTWVTFLKNKSKAFDKFKAFKALVENETDMKIKFLRPDNGGEFPSTEFEEFCETHGIKR